MTAATGRWSRRDAPDHPGLAFALERSRSVTRSDEHTAHVSTSADQSGDSMNREHEKYERLIKRISSPVAGRANVLVVPDLEAGNMLAKSLSFLAQADAAGIVLGARVPIILTSRADSVTTRLASCAIASLVANVR